MTKLTKDILERWQKAKAQAEYWAATERELRNEIFATGFPQPKEGTNSLTLPNTWTLKAVHKMNYTLEKDVAKLKPIMASLIQSGLVERVIANRLVTFEPKLSVSEYKKLPDAAVKLFADVLTIKPGAPSLELVPPKPNA